MLYLFRYRQSMKSQMNLKTTLFYKAEKKRYYFSGFLN